MTNLQIIRREKFSFVLTSLVYLASGLALQKISLNTNSHQTLMESLSGASIQR